MDYGVPARTSYWLCQAISKEISSIREEAVKIIDSYSAACPAAAAMIHSFLNDAIATRLLDHSAWISAYAANPMMKIFLSFAKAPSLTTDTML